MFLSDFPKVTQLESDWVRIQTQVCVTGKQNETGTHVHMFPPAAAAIGTTKQKLALSSTRPFIPNHTFCGD